VEHDGKDGISCGSSSSPGTDTGLFPADTPGHRVDAVFSAPCDLNLSFSFRLGLRVGRCLTLLVAPSLQHYISKKKKELLTGRSETKTGTEVSAP